MTCLDALPLQLPNCCTVSGCRSCRGVVPHLMHGRKLSNVEAMVTAASLPSFRGIMANIKGAGQLTKGPFVNLPIPLMLAMMPPGGPTGLSHPGLDIWQLGGYAPDCTTASLLRGLQMACEHMRL